ncbi:FAD:protein FMN transferase [Aliiglaciecola sp. CAU 1673]|uniref:FAD:protein FMN transferase n=1 Tax=Aliiglaciecola sp. CAU 1673 TaxID=3032595 RepID=UPI0023DB672F|nr:FAD:protein FMN transferase [Aliiglaciecola sp. CAU 1673]MDF2177148.1 FAD:protein FMN transferase [Aliiglaciecola sp. CAU 1673]
MIHRRVKPLLGTFVEVGFTQQNQVGSLSVAVCLERAFAAIANIEQLLNGHAADSELTLLNRRPGVWLSLHRHTRRVLRLAKALGQQTQDRFNVTVGGELTRKGLLPCFVEHDYLDRGDARDIELQGHQVRLKRPVVITLDGIAKGYAVDMAVSALRKAGVKGGWVNAGGDLRVFGEQSLAVKIRDVDGYQQPLKLHNCALASSRYAGFQVQDFTSAIIAKDGIPSPQTEEIISVQSRFAWRADALTKVFVGIEGQARKEIIASLKGKLPALHGGE